MTTAFRLTLFLLLAASTADAQGFSYYSQSACTLGRGGTGVAAPCQDGSAAYFNPAGLVQSKGVATLGADLVFLNGRFTADAGGTATEQEGTILPVPHAYVSYPLSPRVSAGLGVFVPYGLGIRWPRTFRGAFSGSRGEVTGIYLQPTIAARVAENLMVGLGVNLVRSEIRIDQALDLASTIAATTPEGPITFGQLGIPAGTAFAETTLSGQTWASGWHVGAILPISDFVSVGGRYLAEVVNDFAAGTATFRQRSTGISLPEGNPLGLPANSPLDASLATQFEPGGPLTEQSIATSIVFPAQAVVGIQVRPSDTLRLLADYMWTDWSAFQEVVVDFEVLPQTELIQDYEDTGTVRVGGEWVANDTFVLRGGLSYNGPASPDVTVTPLLPEGARRIVYGGLGVAVAPGVQVDFFVDRIFERQRRGRLLPRSARSIPAEALNEGVFSNSGMELGVTGSFRFGN